MLVLMLRKIKLAQIIAADKEINPPQIQFFKILDHGRRILQHGGFHLFAASDETLAWTAGKLKEARVAYFLGAHCTGVEAVFRIRQALGLARKAAVVGAVGSSFTLGTGIDPKALAQ